MRSEWRFFLSEESGVRSGEWSEEWRVERGEWSVRSEELGGVRI